MSKEKINVRKEGYAVKRPIQRILVMRGALLMLLLCILFSAVSYITFSRTLYSNYNDKLDAVIKYVEHHADVEDLKRCVETGVKSEEYLEYQQFLNGMIDDLELDYLYIVIPKETVLVNVISATSAAEFAEGATDMDVNEESDAYTPEELQRYRSFWNNETIGYFEESSDYGAFYTACKPLRDSSGETVALICVDLSVDMVHGSLNRVLMYSVLFAVISVGFFGALTIIWLRKNVTNPLLALENSTREYAKKSRGAKSTDELNYESPNVRTENEVQSLGEAIVQMTDDIRVYVEDAVSAERRADLAEQEKQRFALEAEATRKISELSNSLVMLLSNIPALTFVKDIETGKYLACNRRFAEYANKKTPEEVEGLTDHDMFDKETADHFVEFDMKMLKMDEPYVYYEEALDTFGNPRQFQTTKLKFVDASGYTRVLGMSVDVTEMMNLKEESERAKEAYKEAKSESVTYSNIARALSLDYTYLYYINLETDEFIEYHSDKEGETLSVERRGPDFFGQSRKDAMTMLHEDDREMFVGVFRKDNIVKTIDEHGTFTLTYRMLINGEPVYLNMKATKMKGDDKHLIIGVNNVDEQMKYQEAIERIKEEQITYTRISALSGDYICIYTVDPDTDHYIEYSATKDYEGLGLAKEGDDFFARSAAEGEANLYSEDRERFIRAFTKENVIKEIKENGLFVLDYRLILGGNPVYVSLKAAMINEKDGPQLIVGILNIDKQVKRDEEYAYNLSVERNKANIDALTGVKNKHAYVDVETSLNRSLEEGEKVEFALVVFDVNGLKQVNDTQGHREGDELIKSACAVICGIFKHSPVFRIGGDEFAVIAQGQDYENIEELVDKVALANKASAVTDGVIVACGMAKYNSERSVSGVFERADSLMYKNKKELKGN